MEFLTVAAGAVIIIAASRLVPLAIMFVVTEKIRSWSVVLMAAAAVLLWVGGVDSWFTTVSAKNFF